METGAFAAVGFSDHASDNQTFIEPFGVNASADAVTVAVTK